MLVSYFVQPCFDIFLQNIQYMLNDGPVSWFYLMFSEKSSSKIAIDRLAIINVQNQLTDFQAQRCLEFIQCRNTYAQKIVGIIYVANFFVRICRFLDREFNSCVFGDACGGFMSHVHWSNWYNCGASMPFEVLQTVQCCFKNIPGSTTQHLAKRRTWLRLLWSQTSIFRARRLKDLHCCSNPSTDSSTQLHVWLEWD